MIDVENLVHEIELKTGIPAALLTAADADGVLHQARELLELRQNNTTHTNEAGQREPTREQFAQWFESVYQYGGERKPDPAQAALDEIEKAFDVQRGVYPVVPDGGEATGLDPRSPKEMFSEWFHGVSGQDFRRDDDGFVNIVP